MVGIETARENRWVRLVALVAWTDMGPHSEPSPSLAAIKERILRGGEFDVEERPSGLRLWRRRSVPRRGLFRLLIPRVRADVSEGGSWKLRPDGLALFMCVMLAGGVFVEAVVDRAKYPREYPPAFIYALAGIYLVLCVAEIFRTRHAIGAALGGPFS